MEERVTNLRTLPVALWLGLVFGTLAGCVDKDTVFAGKPGVDEPTETVNRFLGYVKPVEEQQTSCGNCHATFQAGWATTGHYDAWEGLGIVPGAQENPVCWACHTISSNGNPAEGDAGYVLVQDDRYVDVQCESCHGSGWDHVNSPNAENAPLCSIRAATDATTGCGECHQDDHHPFVEQWELSAHANVGFASGRAGCDECHEGRKALERKFYDTSNYLEKDGEELMPIVCAICHDPHGTGFDSNLRAPIDVAGSGLPSNDHLCVRCHSRQGTPPSTHGPHAAQGLLVIQEDIGWIPADFEAPPVGGHGRSDSNPKLCVTCHVVRFTIEDQATGEFEFESVGHTFEALPCLDANGRPDPTLDCEVADRSFTGCTTCHVHTENEARALYDLLQNDLNALLDQLWVDGDGNGVVDPTDGGLIPMVAARALSNPADTLDLDPRDELITVAEGVFWNAQIAHTDGRDHFADAIFYQGIAGPDEDEDGVPDGIEWESHKASGNGVHNPNFLEALLEASIAALIDFYGLTP